MAEVAHSIPAQRRAVILERLASKGTVTIRELEEFFGVSHMTVHRDLDALAQEGSLHKVRGGAVRGAQIGSSSTLERRCNLCGMRVSPRTEVTLTRHDQSQLHACCAHCGLLLLRQQADVESGLARDFLYGRMTNMRQAVFVVDSQIRPCCMPSTLCFASHAEAAGFQKGFGGRVLSFREAQELLATTHGQGHGHTGTL